MALSRNARLRPTDLDQPPGNPESGANIVIVASSDDGEGLPTVTPDLGTADVPTEEGGVVVDFAPKQPNPKRSKGHFENLAEVLDESALDRIVSDVLLGVQADLDSRKEWEAQREEGIKMLGTRLEAPYAPAGDATQSFEGMARIRHPLLLEAIARFQATAAAELYPPSGPVKVRDDRPVQPEDAEPPPPPMGHNGGPPMDGAPAPPVPPPPPGRDEIAEALEKGFNHNLTVVDRGYRPDSVRMLFSVAFDGCAFKKIYDCPIRRRPVSRFVQAKDIIVSDAACHERDAGRITHRIMMDKTILRRMEIAGVYREIALSTPSYTEDPIDRATAEAQGLTPQTPRQEDQKHEIYETYLDLDVPGYEHEEKGEKTGLPLPYRISIDKTSRKCLELRRNWEEDDDTFQPRHTLVKFGYIPALGFYDIGLLHLLGNGDRALTAAWRMAIDTAMFGNFPGFIYNEGAIRNWSNQNRIPPGGGLGIKGLSPNVPLNQVIMPVPYKDLGQGLIALIQHLEQRMDRVAGTGEIQVAEGRQDAPVGTTLALLENATKIMAAVFVGLHASQADEFQLLKDRYARNPQAFWRWNKKGMPQWEEAEFLQALEDYEFVPAADPNTPSGVVRIARAWAILQLAQQAPGLFKAYQAARRFLVMVGVPNPDEILNKDYVPPTEGPAGPDPNRMAAVTGKMEAAKLEAQTKMAELQMKGEQDARKHALDLVEQSQAAQNDERSRELAGQQEVLASTDRAADRASRERIAVTRLAAERDRLASSERTEAARMAHDRQLHLEDTAAKQAWSPLGLAAPPPPI